MIASLAHRGRIVGVYIKIGRIRQIQRHILRDTVRIGQPVSIHVENVAPEALVAVCPFGNKRQ